MRCGSNTCDNPSSALTRNGNGWPGGAQHCARTRGNTPSFNVRYVNRCSRAHGTSSVIANCTSCGCFDSSERSTNGTYIIILLIGIAHHEHACMRTQRGESYDSDAYNM